ncbi:MAG: lycopene cyclase family protein [Vicingaceae bacterium]
MNQDKIYDIAIIGGGLAGLQLAFGILQENDLADKSILILEKENKTANDKSWSFWEKGQGRWDEIVHKSWSKADFTGRQFSRRYELTPYAYKMIRSEDFYAFVKEKIVKSPNVQWQKDQVQEVIFGDPHQCIGEKSSYSATTVFDSRLTDDFENSDYPFVLQHFKGWFIETDHAVFDDSTFQMMDFENEHKANCAFTYVLPFSPQKALVEFTFFSPQLVDDKVYETEIKEYIHKKLNIQQYQITETEKGVIPMSAYPFQEGNQNNYLKIGTGGGWVKSSSGYSFKNTSNKIKQVISNLKEGKALDYNLFQKRFQFYDRIYLSVLQSENQLGAQLFEEMYHRNDIQNIFKFLDEQSQLSDEIKLISKFSKAPFLKALRREYLR